MRASRENMLTTALCCGNGYRWSWNCTWLSRTSRRGNTPARQCFRPARSVQKTGAAQPAHFERCPDCVPRLRRCSLDRELFPRLPLGFERRQPSRRAPAPAPRFSGLGVAKLGRDEFAGTDRSRCLACRPLSSATRGMLSEILGSNAELSHQRHDLGNSFPLLFVSHRLELGGFRLQLLDLLADCVIGLARHSLSYLLVFRSAKSLRAPGTMNNATRDCGSTGICMTPLERALPISEAKAIASRRPQKALALFRLNGVKKPRRNASPPAYALYARRSPTAARAHGRRLVAFYPDYATVGPDEQRGAGFGEEEQGDHAGDHARRRARRRSRCALPLD